MILSEVRKTFLAGLLVLTPITLTVFILTWLFRLIDVNLREWVYRAIIEPRNYDDWIVKIPGLGLLVILALIILAGVIARNLFGRKLLDIADFIVTRIPLVNRIYIAIREISEAILSEKREVFKKAVLIEYPRKGAYSVAFYTQDTKGPVQDQLEEDVVSLFVPTTPNPTSGYLLFIPKKDVKDLDMSVEDALKLVISGGSIHLKNTRDPDPFQGLSKRLKKPEAVAPSDE
jgi:uncharacterized membrane protein